MDNPFDDLQKNDEEYEKRRLEAYNKGSNLAYKFNHLVSRTLESYGNYLGKNYRVIKTSALFDKFLDKSSPDTNLTEIYFWGLSQEPEYLIEELYISLQFRFIPHQHCHYVFPAEQHYLLVTMMDKDEKFWNLIGIIMLTKQSYESGANHLTVAKVLEIETNNYLEKIKEISIQEIVEKMLLYEIKRLHSLRFPKV